MMSLIELVSGALLMVGSVVLARSGRKNEDRGAVGAAWTILLAGFALAIFAFLGPPATAG